MDTITITLTRYKEPNWLLNDALVSLSKQVNIFWTVLVLDQFFSQETKDFCSSLDNEFITFRYSVIEPRWLSYARNTAIKICDTPILLYIDSDAVANKQWAYNLTKTLSSDSNIAIVGWKIIPRFHKKPPFLIKADFIADIYSLLDLWDMIKPYTKVIGANFWIKIPLLWNNSYFDENLWRKPWKLLWWEEWDLCNRALANWLEIYYDWTAIVDHQILPERLNIFWILKRLYWWWYNRWLAGWIPRTNSGIQNTWNYIIFFIIWPSYGAWLIMWKIKK